MNRKIPLLALLFLFSSTSFADQSLHSSISMPRFASLDSLNLIAVAGPTVNSYNIVSSSPSKIVLLEQQSSKRAQIDSLDWPELIVDLAFCPSFKNEAASLVFITEHKVYKSDVGQGKLYFKPFVSLPTGRPFRVECGDLDNDHEPEIIVTSLYDFPHHHDIAHIEFFTFYGNRSLIPDWTLSNHIGEIALSTTKGKTELWIERGQEEVGGLLQRYYYQDGKMILSDEAFLDGEEKRIISLSFISTPKGPFLAVNRGGFEAALYAIKADEYIKTWSRFLPLNATEPLLSSLLLLPSTSTSGTQLWMGISDNPIEALELPLKPQTK